MYDIIILSRESIIMIINKAYKFRLYPNKEQKELINKTFGCTRLVYNYYLNKKQELYKEKKTSISRNDIIKDIINLYNMYPFLKEVDRMALNNSLFDLDNSYNKFFKEHTGYPKFKRKYDKNSYRTNLITSSYKDKIYENIKVDLVNKTIILPKLKKIKIRGYRNIDKIDGRIINATISREANRYYVSVVYEQKMEINDIKPKSIIGIDLGIKDLVITSTCKKYANEKNIRKYEYRIKKLQKELSRKNKGSNNYYKVKIKLQRVYQKLRNARKYLIHNITREITNEYDIIVMETLKVKNMLKNHHLSKSIADASFNEIKRQLEYKCKWKGKILYSINTFYPSSQICSICGYQNKKAKDLTIRKYECSSCHHELDRDINAAENIAFEGLKIYMKGLI